MYVKILYLINRIDLMYYYYSNAGVFSYYLELYTSYRCCDQNRKFSYLGYVVTRLCQYLTVFRFKQTICISQVGVLQHSKLC
jgi:hypothetical protein